MIRTGQQGKKIKKKHSYIEDYDVSFLLDFIFGNNPFFDRKFQMRKAHILLSLIDLVKIEIKF